MKKRGIGFTWVLAVMSDQYSKTFKWMKDPDWTRRGLIDYMREGSFTDEQKKRWLPELRQNYEKFVRQDGRKPHPFPIKLEAEMKALLW